MDTTTRRILAILAMTVLSLPSSPDLLGQDLGLEAEIPAEVTEASADPIGRSSETPGTTDEATVEDLAVSVSEDGMFGNPIKSMIGEEPAEFYSSGTSFKNGRWYTELDFVMLFHGQPRGVVFAWDAASGREYATGETAFLYEPGMRITIGKQLGRDQGDRDHSIEFSYMGLFDWTIQESFSAARPGDVGFGIPGSLNTVLGVAGTPIAGFNNADQQSYTYGTDLDSFEFNLRMRTRPERDRLVLQPDGRWVRHDAESKIKSFLAGLRVVSMEESFLYTSQGTVPTANQGRYQVTTHNDMVGIHFGMELIEKHTEWTWGVRGKVGGLVNFADRQSRIDTVNGISSAAEDLANENMVFLTSGSLFGSYYVRPNMAFTASYEAMYLTGLALAPENLGYDGNNFARFNIGGDVLLHGLFLGMEWTW